MNKKIKIFVDAHSFDKELQGTQTFIRELYTAILQNYPDVDIYMGAFHIKRVLAAFPMLDPARVLAYKNIGIRRMLTDIPALIKQHQFEFAHFQYISPRPVKNCRYIVTLHDLMYKEMPQYFSAVYTQLRTVFFKRSFLRAQLKTTVSEHSRKSISHHYGTDATDIHVIPNAVNNSFGKYFSSTADATQKIRQQYGLENFILYVSRIEPRKNHLLLLKAYLKNQLYKQNIPLVFIGTHSIPVPEMNVLINMLDADQKKFIHFFQDVSQEDLLAFYTSCRLFVYPSKGEGFGIPPLEAAVCGAPVLCSNASAMKDFVFFHPHTFDPSDEKDFESKLMNMIINPVSKEFIREVSTAIAKSYCWEKSASHFYKILQPVSL